MVIRLLVLYVLLFFIQPTFGLFDNFLSFNIVRSSKMAPVEYDNFEIDFDALDKELEDMPVSEPQKQWWITKQIKHYGTRVMIKALLGYITLHEYCVGAWHITSKKMRMLLALCYGPQRKHTHEVTKS